MDKEDREVKELILDQFKAAGIEVRDETENRKAMIMAIMRNDNKIQLEIEGDGKELKVLLVALIEELTGEELELDGEDGE